MSCFVHSEREAVGHCVECGKAVCMVCLNKESGRIYCDICSRLRSNSSHSGGLRLFDQQLNTQSLAPILTEKNRYVAAFLAFFTGYIGVHKFYLNQIGWGILYVAFSWTFIPLLVSWIEGIIYLSQSDEAFALQNGSKILIQQIPATQNPQLNSQNAPARLNLPFQLKKDQDYERLLLLMAKDRQGVLTVSEVAVESNLSIEKAEHHLANLAGKGYARAEIDEETGRISYVFPEFKNKYLN